MKTEKKNRELAEIKRKIVPLLKKEGVTRAGIFGSYARGEQKRSSDIDILIEVRKGTGLFKFIGIKQELEKKLGKKVDLLTYKSIHPLLRDEICGDERRII
jgi:predicted nucleotidyltransferase